MKNLILKEHPNLMCDKYPLNYNSSSNNSDQTKLIVSYCSLGTCSIAFRGYICGMTYQSISKNYPPFKLFIKKYGDLLVEKISN